MALTPKHIWGMTSAGNKKSQPSSVAPFDSRRVCYICIVPPCILYYCIVWNKRGVDKGLICMKRLVERLDRR